MSNIPMSADVAAILGPFAEKMENPALRYQKYVLPKCWGHPFKVDDAARWNVLRLVQDGVNLLKKDAQNIEEDKRRAERKNNVEKAEKCLYLSSQVQQMGRMSKSTDNLMVLVTANTKELLQQISQTYGTRGISMIATLRGRLIINQAGGVIENAGMALDRCFGVPYIPGSALKGITRHAALWEIRDAGPESREILALRAAATFGFSDPDIAERGAFGWATHGDRQILDKLASVFGAKLFKGCCSFLPAYPASVPVLVADMINPHTHGNPIPNYFPAVEAGVQFGFAVVLQRDPPQAVGSAESVLAQTKVWIDAALTETGVGAKTGAGYGWFGLKEKSDGAVVSSTSTPESLASDFTEKTFGGAIVARLDKKGEWQLLKAEVEKLRRPQNAEWLMKFKQLTQSKEYKDIRSKEWYPK
ncbi:MAG: type III-B CRISPR module RAMP protein Cmr6 [Lentisphaerota bacterium]